MRPSRVDDDLCGALLVRGRAAYTLSGDTIDLGQAETIVNRKYAYLHFKAQHEQQLQC